MSDMDQSYRVTAQELRQFIERAERVQAEIKDLQDTLKEVFAEAKGRGYDVPVLRKVIALRKRDAHDVAEEEAVLDMYKEALGIGGTVQEYVEMTQPKSKGPHTPVAHDAHHDPLL